jgi:hypothetical protein
MVATINFGQQFVRDLSKGKDYSQAVERPEPIIINVPKEGMTDCELAEASQKQKNVANAWQYAIQYLQTAQLSAQAHELAGKVQSAEIKASTAWEEVLTTYATHQSAELNRELAEFKLDVDRQKFEVTKEDLLVQLQQVQVQHGANVLQLLESAHTLITQRVVTALKGVNVSSVPEIKFDEIVAQLPPVDFTRTVDLDAYMKDKQQVNVNQA